MEGLPECKATIRKWVSVQMLSTLPPFVCLGLIFHYWSNKRPEQVVWLGLFLVVSLLVLVATYVYTKHRIDEYWFAYLVDRLITL